MQHSFSTDQRTDVLVKCIYIYILIYGCHYSSEAAGGPPIHRWPTGSQYNILYITLHIRCSSPNHRPDHFCWNGVCPSGPLTRVQPPLNFHRESVLSGARPCSPQWLRHQMRPAEHVAPVKNAKSLFYWYFLQNILSKSTHWTWKSVEDLWKYE